MPIYLTNATVPELSGFTAAQCRLIRRKAFATLCHERPSVRVLAALPGGVGGGIGFGLGVLLCHVAFAQHRMAVAVVCGMIGGGVGGFIGGQWLTEQLRPHLRRFIEEHRDEITRAA